MHSKEVVHSFIIDSLSISAPYAVHLHVSFNTAKRKVFSNSVTQSAIVYTLCFNYATDCQKDHEEQQNCIGYTILHTGSSYGGKVPKFSAESLCLHQGVATRRQRDSAENSGTFPP